MYNFRLGTCNGFYQCANGHRYEDQWCPDGLLFSEETNRCESPADVDCDGGTYCDNGIYPVPG